MAEIKLTIPDDKVNLVITAYCDTMGYQENIADDDLGTIIPNPETRAAFTKRMIIKEIKDRVRMSERKAAEAAIVNVDIDIT